MSIISAAHFHNEEAAYAFVEGRIWPHGPVCPKCGVIGGHYKLNGKSTRIGVHKCGSCRKPFTVKIGTIFEASHLDCELKQLYIVTVITIPRCYGGRGYSLTLEAAIRRMRP